ASMLVMWRRFISLTNSVTGAGSVSPRSPSSLLTTHPWPRFRNRSRAARVGSLITFSAKSPFFSDVIPPSVLMQRTSPAQAQASSPLTPSKSLCIAGLRASGKSRESVSTPARSASCSSLSRSTVVMPRPPSVSDRERIQDTAGGPLRPGRSHARLGHGHLDCYSESARDHHQRRVARASQTHMTAEQLKSWRKAERARLIAARETLDAATLERLRRRIDAHLERSFPG